MNAALVLVLGAIVGFGIAATGSRAQSPTLFKACRRLTELARNHKSIVSVPDDWDVSTFGH
jgi:hypothetical protein